MSQVHAAFSTAGAVVAQRAMIDYDALDSLVDPYRVHPDTDGRDETVILRRLESLVARLRTSEGSPSTAAQVSKRGADIAMSGTVEDLSLIHISEPTRLIIRSRMPSSA